MQLHVITITAALALLMPACTVERIDAIIAEHGVTYCPTSGSSTADTSTSTSAGSGSEAGETSSTGGASASMSGGDAVDTSSSTGSNTSSGEPPGPVCGDSVIAGDEECDDGNAQDGDACRNDCKRRWIVFVTSEPFKQGKFNGITGADYECRHRATNMFLPNGERYMAWLSTSEVQPADRMYHARGPYVLVNGLQVAANWDALTSGTLEHSVNVTEKGETVDITVWTGTDITGLRLPNTQLCSDWTYHDSDRTGWLADSTATDAFWTRGIESDCGAYAAIYCFEQP
jgi:cysteine-rich repeat protein